MPNSPHKSHLDIAPEIADALRDDRPVVALESTIISHGMPYPRNVATARQVEATVREHGAIPATIAVLGGRLRVGITHDEIDYLGKRGQRVVKTSRRDLPFVVCSDEDGATTVAATMIIAAMAGIHVFATGGIGGVHRGVEETLDISADLEELARTNVAVVCAGPKSVLDIGRTREFLETRGVPVVGFQTDTLPAFYTRESEFAVDYRIDTFEEIAKVMRVKWDLRLRGGMVIANPIPKEAALGSKLVDAVINRAVTEMRKKGISGKDVTPYLLAKIAEQTDGKSLDANIQLVLNNARVAAGIAAAFTQLETSLSNR